MVVIIFKEKNELNVKLSDMKIMQLEKEKLCKLISSENYVDKMSEKKIDFSNVNNFTTGNITQTKHKNTSERYITNKNGKILY